MRFTTAIVERYRKRETSVEDRGRLRDPAGLERLDVDSAQPGRAGLRLGRGVAHLLPWSAPTPTLLRRDICVLLGLPFALAYRLRVELQLRF